MLFVAGDPVPLTELARVLDCPQRDVYDLLCETEALWREEGRGVQLLVTGETAQLVSNKDYIGFVEQLVHPDETKNVSQSLMETLAIIAYRQPATRADVERIRGVRCDYAVTQLVKLGLIVVVGRKDVVGKPALFGTTDRFLRQFGIHEPNELPDYARYSAPILEEDAGEIPVV